MNLNEINFSFGGLHCLRDFGCIYVEKSGHFITPTIARDEYEIAGVAGTILMGDGLPEAVPFSGSLYFLNTPPTQAAAQEQLRRISAWLTAGRQRLIFDYEPGRYYMASVSDALKWTYSGYLDGGLDIAFDAQPYAYALRETTASMVTATASAQLTLTLDTGEDAPLGVTIRNTGTAPITGAVITANGKKAALSGMSIAQNASLTLNMEPPIGATFSNGSSALPHADQFDQLTAHAGLQPIDVAMTYGSGTKGAKITLNARGRWK